MAELRVHIDKANMFRLLAKKSYEARLAPFIGVNLVMYTVGHLIEALLARQNRHPSCPPRGVPHGDREAMLRKHLVPQNIVEEKWANCYSELVGRRDTFIEGGIPEREFLEEFARLGEPLVVHLYERLGIEEPSTRVEVGHGKR